MVGEITWLVSDLGLARDLGDSTRLLTLACLERGLRCQWACVETLRLSSGCLTVDVGACTSDCGRLVVDSPLRREVSKYEYVVMRADPPFDQQYIQIVQCLAILERLGKVHLATPASTLILGCSKTIGVATGLEGLSGCVMFDQGYGFEHSFPCYLKRLDGGNSNGVKLLESSHAFMDARNEIVGGVLVQCVAEAKDESRIWFVDGECVKLASHRCRQLCSQLADILKKLNVWLAAVDVVDGHVLDVNLASPGRLESLTLHECSIVVEAACSALECRLRTLVEKN